MAFRGPASCQSCPISRIWPAAPDWRVASRFDDEWTNLLFVGRVIPNKRIEDLVRIFHAYRTTINPRSRLLVVGSYGGFEKYLAMVQSVAARLGTPDVHFAGHVSDEELVAYYEVADLFLCASEHEGFCVPLIEAFHMGRAGCRARSDRGSGDPRWRRRAL